MGKQWKSWDPGLGPKVVRPPSSPATDYVTNPKSDRLIFLDMGGWLANFSWLADWLSNNMSTWASPSPRHLVAKCFFTLVRLTCGQMYPQQAETSYSQVWYYFRSGWPVSLRVSLVPAAVVIPVPLAYIEVVAVKKLILLLFVETTKFKSYLSSYHPMQKA